MGLFTPEAAEMSTVTLIKSRSIDLLAGYVLLEDVAIKPLVKEQLSRCYNIAGVEHHFLEALPKAREWLSRLNSTEPLNKFLLAFRVIRPPLHRHRLKAEVS